MPPSLYLAASTALAAESDQSANIAPTVPIGTAAKTRRDSESMEYQSQPKVVPDIAAVEKP